MNSAGEYDIKPHRGIDSELCWDLSVDRGGFIWYFCVQKHLQYIVKCAFTWQESAFASAGAYRNGSLCSHICDLLCPRMLPPPNHTPLVHTHEHTHMHTRTHTHTLTRSYSTLDRPGCQSYTNSHPLAAGIQDNHGNQSLTPGETSSRTERLHSISTSQYSTHKRTHMHTFHTLTHTHWRAHTHSQIYTHKHTHTHRHGHVQRNPLALTASQSLQPSLPASTGVSGSLLERPHTTSSHPRSSTAHTQRTSETLITPHSLWLNTLLEEVDRLFISCTKIIFLPPRRHGASQEWQRTALGHITGLQPRWQSGMCILVSSHGRCTEVRFVSCRVIFFGSSAVSPLRADVKTKVW